MAPIRICLTGPESTGKTWLATEMAVGFGTTFVPEYARQYAQATPRPLDATDVEPIARGEIALLDAPAAGNLLILDTDLISTVVYGTHYYGSCPDWIVQEALRRRADYYFLLDVDTPFADDAVRDGTQDRHELLNRFRDTLVEFEARFELVGGTWEARRARVFERCGVLLSGEY